MTSLKNRNHTFWLDDISILFDDNNYLEFFPRYESTREEQLNAITRFCIYLFILAIAFKMNDKYIYFSLVTIISTIFLNTINMSDSKKKQKDINKIIDDRLEHMHTQFVKERYAEPNNYVNSDANISNYTFESQNDGKTVESGYFDSSGNMVIGTDYDKPCYKCNDTRPVHTYDEIMSYRKGTCRKPTNDNPFMNPAVTEFNDGEVPVACNVDDNEIKEDMERKFNDNLYRNVDDVWDIENSRRQFYTIPTGNYQPENQTDFANWLYKTPCICKEDNGACAPHEDLRFKR